LPSLLEDAFELIGCVSRSLSRIWIIMGLSVSF